MPNATTPTPTLKLIALCQQGEREAQGEFYQKYRLEVGRILYKVLGPHHELEDAVQDVFIEVFRSIGSYQSRAKITTWLYRVCVNVALQKIRRVKRRPEGYATEEVDLPGDETPYSSVERKETSRLIYEVLDTLAQKKRVVFILHEIMGLDSKEISSIVGSNALTVRTRLHYARKEFYQKALETDLFRGRAR